MNIEFSKFWVIIHITSEFDLYERKTKTLLTEVWGIIHVTSEFNFLKN